MKCKRCGQDNPVEAKFCLECATPFERRCTRCGTALPPTAKFCFECAEPAPDQASAVRFSSPATYTPKHLAERILTSKAAVEGERKHVTVLFADLKGSMELLADRDPEEARALLDPVLDLMMEAVHRYEGTVNQVMGDGIMALFGAPVAHEDHAVRACYAAIRMQEAVRSYADEVFRSHGAVVQIRIGLNSGEVVVRSIGSDLRMDYTAVGHTTHVAARMEQLASPGSTLLAPATMALVEGHVEVRVRGPVAVKGLAEAMEVFELAGASGARSRLQAAAARGLTKFVGRADEMERLFSAVAAARAGRGQVVAVVGEPGVGKSRLLWELTHSHRLQSRPDAAAWRVLECGAVSYGSSVPYLPVVELLRGYFLVEPGEDVRRTREKVMGRLLALDRTLEPALPALLALLDVPSGDREWDGLEPLQRRHRTLDGLKRLLLRESQVQPLLVIVEDLHWIDAETQAALDNLVDAVAGAPVLLLVNFRPEYVHRWSSKPHFGQLRIEPLPSQSAEDLLDSLLGSDAGLASLRRLLVERTDGNPFFLEESVRTLVETRALIGARGRYRLAGPASGLQVPASVQAILAARIDRLPPDDKRVLQTAAVIGKDVPWAVLAEVVDLPEGDLRASLARVHTGELLLESRLFPDPEYSFKHALTHDVAYDSLLHDRRRALHGAVVDAIERLHAGRLAEHAEDLARHARLAERWDRAARYLRSAGNKAVNRSANREAADYLEGAAASFGRLPQTPETIADAIDVRFELRIALRILRADDRLAACLADALRLAEALGDQRRLGYVIMFSTLHAVLGEQFEEGARLGQRAIAIGEAIGELGIVVGARCYLGIGSTYFGRYAEAAALCEQALALIPPDRIHDLFGQARIVANLAHGVRAFALARLGRFPEAIAHAEEAFEIARRANQTYSLTSSSYDLGLIRLMKGDHEEAARDLERAQYLWETLQAPVPGPVLAWLGLAHCRMGRIAKGLALLGSGEWPGIFWVDTSAVLGEAHLLAGHSAEATEHVEHALATARAKGYRPFEADALHLRAEIAARSKPVDAAAQEHYRGALAIAEALGMRPLVGRCHLGLGTLLRRTGDAPRAREHLTLALSMLRDMDMRYWRDQAEVEIAALS